MRFGGDQPYRPRGADALAAERRLRARKAFWDTSGGLMTGAPDGLEAAIETATRVRLTPEIENAAEAATGRTIHDYDAAEMRAVLAAAFRAAGFEIEE